jgi:hypothetical protein
MVILLAGLLVTGVIMVVIGLIGGSIVTILIPGIIDILLVVWIVRKVFFSTHKKNIYRD